MDERPAVCALINLAYDAESYGPSLANPVVCVGDAHMDPHDRPENTRVLLVDGEIVSALHIWEREAYARGDKVPFGIVTTVATHPAHRRKGYVRRLMADAEDYLRGRGFAYGLLMGVVHTYGGSVGWRLAAEDRETLDRKYVVGTTGAALEAVSARRATVEDIPFLSGLYGARYPRFFGPVVRSEEFWRRWSLARTWDGTYEVAMRGGARIGYFHLGNRRDSADEIAWEPADASAAAATFRAAASLAAGEGASEVSFWIGEDPAAAAALKTAFGDARRAYCAPDGQPAATGDRAPYRQANWQDGFGYMVRFLNPGPGILSGVRSTEDLTAVMARHSWVYLDGDGV